MIEEKDLIHINVQTNCNLSFSLLTIEELIENCLRHKQHTLAICDYNPYEFLKFYYLCKKSNLKPVWGFKKVVKYQDKILIINLFPFSYLEYRELNKLFWKQKEMDLDFGLVGGLTAKSIVILEVRNNSELQLASEFRSDISQTDGSYICNFYIGLNFFPTSLTELKKIGVDYLLCFFSVKALDWDNFQLLQTLKTVNFTNNLPDVDKTSIAIPYLGIDQLREHFKSSLEASDIRFVDELFETMFFNLNICIEKISLSIRKSSSNSSLSSFNLLSDECEDSITKLPIEIQKKDRYHAVLSEELKIIKDRGYADYFLALSKIIKAFTIKSIEIGPGRGSASSSLVSYLLGITQIDPVKNDLFFWRFLNEKRTDFPDIDVDVENQEFALQVIAELHGYDSVAKLIVKQRLGWSAALSTSLKIFQIDAQDSQFIEENSAKFVFSIHEKHPSLHVDCLYQKYATVFAFAARLQSLYIAATTHPSGILISSEKLVKKLPIRQSKDFPICLYQQEYIGNLGFKKFDFLSLTESLSFVKHIKEKNCGRVPGFRTLNINDARTWVLLRESLLNGIFQINTKFFSRIIAQFQPSNFSELLLVISLNRPGTSESLKEILEMRSGRSAIQSPFKNKDLIKIFELTYGRMVFEEQISQVLSYCLDIDFAEAEVVRRKLGVIFNSTVKKREFKVSFIKGSSKKLTVVERDFLWNQLITSVPYMYNKAHAVSYAYLTYYTAYLKANFFTDSILYFLQRNAGDQQASTDLVKEAVLFGYSLVNPEINSSAWHWTIEGTSFELQMGFSQLAKSSARPFFEELLKERAEHGKFKNWNDLLIRLCNGFARIEQQVFADWVKVGMFRSLSGDPQWIVEHFSLLRRYAMLRKVLRDAKQQNLPFFSPPTYSRPEGFSQAEINKNEWKIFGFYFSYIANWKKLNDSKFFKLATNHYQLTNSSQSQLYSIVTNLKKVNDGYAVELTNLNSPFEIFITDKLYEENLEKLFLYNELLLSFDHQQRVLGKLTIMSIASFAEIE